MRKTFRLIFICVWLCMMTGCGKRPEGLAENIPAGEPTDIEICSYGLELGTYDRSADIILDELEKKTNTVITFKSYDVNTYIESIIADFNAGTSSDLIQNWGDKDTTGIWASQDWIVDLYPTVKESPGRYPVLNLVMNDPVYKLYNDVYTGDTEKAYGFYTILATPMYNNYVGDLVYNTSILNEAGFTEPPETIAEFIEYGRAAAEKGYIPWYPRNWNLSVFHNMNYSMLSPLGTALEAPNDVPWTGMRMRDDGVWECVTTSESSKEGVKVLNQMYREGLLPEDLGIRNDFGETIQMWANDEIGCISYLCVNPYQYEWALSEYKTTHPDATFDDVTLGPLLRAEDGSVGKQNYISFSVTANWVVPKISEGKVQGILDLIDFVGSSDGQTLVFQGIQGIHYTMASTGGHLVFDNAEWNKIGLMFGDELDSCMYTPLGFLYTTAQMRANWHSSGWIEAAQKVVDFTGQKTGYSDDFLAAKEVNDAIQAEVAVELPPYYAFISLSEESIAIRTRLLEITLEYLPAFILGEKDVETEWPAYVQAYQDAGVRRLEDDFNAKVNTAKDKYELLTDS
jgi:ABC-type glycerol-3-phosphate transport system substrate-binding protein